MRSSTINKAAATALLRSEMEEYSPTLAKKMTRVSNEVFVALDQVVRMTLVGWIHQHSRAGATFYPPSHVATRRGTLEVEGNTDEIG